MPSTSSSGTESKGTATKSSSSKRYTLRELAAETDNNVFSEAFLDSSDACNCTQIFTFGELSDATNNLSPDSELGTGEFGNVHRGTLENGQVVAVKRMKNGRHMEKQFKTEILMLSFLCHPNLINLIGYCVEGDERILVYEFMPNHTLEYHLHDQQPEDKKSLDWTTRMKIATGIARGMEYLHSSTQKEHPLVFFKDLKPANILLDDDFHPKISDFGMARFASASKEQKQDLASDISSLGVVLLQLITGRKGPIDMTRTEDHNLLIWALPLLEDNSKHREMVDPNLQNDGYPMDGVSKVLDMAYKCIPYRAVEPPTISNMVNMLSKLVSDQVQFTHQRKIKFST